MGRHSDNTNTSQQHGNEFEDQMRVSRMFSGTIRVEDNGQGAFDIPAACDRTLHLATSVKTSGSDWIGLADAERFCEIDRPWRLLYSRWEQKHEDGHDYKSYDEIHEMIVPLSIMRKILGGLTAEMVLKWHLDIGSFVSGPMGAAAARLRADEIKKQADGMCGHLRLDFKIDDKGQRRLQVSIKFSDLVELLQNLPSYRTPSHTQPHHVVHRGWFHQHRLPIELRSSPRRIERGNSHIEVETPLFGNGVELGPQPSANPAEDIFPSSISSAELRKEPPVRHKDRQRRKQLAAIQVSRQTSLFG